MFWYIAVFAVLVALALVERNQRWPGVVAAAILAIFAALRYETGFDWAEYEQHFLLTTPFGVPDTYEGARTLLEEPTFELLLRGLRTIETDFQGLLLLTAFFNLAVLYCFVRRFSPLVVIVLLVYMGFIFLMGQMATIRQSIAASFVFLAAMHQCEGRWKVAAGFLVAALGFHVTSAAFVLLVFVWGERPAKPWLMVGLSAIGVIASAIDINFFQRIAEAFLQVGTSGFVAEKVAIYSSQVGGQISITALALTLMDIGFAFLIYRQSHTDYIARAAYRGAWLNVILHTWFAPFPLLWNRAMLVTLPLEMVVLCRVLLIPLSSLWTRLGVITAASCTSLAALTFTLLGDQSLVYKPYQNVIPAWIYGPYGDGFDRYQFVRRENAIIYQQKKAQ